MTSSIDGNEKAHIAPEEAETLMADFLLQGYGSHGALTSALRKRGVERTIGDGKKQQFVGLGAQAQQAFAEAAERLDSGKTRPHTPIVLHDKGYGREVHIATGKHAPRRETGEPPSVTVKRR